MGAKMSHFRPDGSECEGWYCVRCGASLVSTGIHGPGFCDEDAELVKEVRDANQPEPSGTLDMQPVGSSIIETAARLVLGHTVGVLLEPGDRTAYRLLLSPCWDEKIWLACGGGIGDGSDYIFVSSMNSRGYPVLKGSDSGYIAGKLKVGSPTATILAEFLKLLWIDIDSLSDDSPEALTILAGDV